jgi:hypothetical protein
VKKKLDKRKTVIKKLKHDMEKDKANPQRLSKWFMLMESKKKLFALEDEIDRLTSELKPKR